MATAMPTPQPRPAPIVLDFPDHFETPRLLIRAPRPGDGAELNAATVETIELLRPWMPWATPCPTPEASERHVREACARFVLREELRLHLYLKGSGILVGSSGLHRIDWNVPRFEIGYWCRRRFQGQGFITEAVRGIASFAFDVLHAQRVEIRCDSRNERSRRVAERAGFTFEARLRNDGRDVEGELRDTLVFSLIPAEY